MNKPPRNLVHAIYLIRKLAYRWKSGERGVDSTVVSNALYYAVEEYRDWGNDSNLTMNLGLGESYTQLAARFFRKVCQHHAILLNDVKKNLREYDDYEAKLAVYATLPFRAPSAVRVNMDVALQKARNVYAQYWRLNTVPEWSYDEMRTMLETGVIIEHENLD